LFRRRDRSLKMSMKTGSKTGCARSYAPGMA
jgi:hypothetical protein